MNFSALLLVILLTVAGGVGLPVGVPPAAEDPMMARVIPEEALLVASWAGIAALDAAADPTQKWMAQPEVQLFSAKLTEAWKTHAAKRRGAHSSEHMTAAQRLLERIAEISLRNATTIYVKNFDVQGRPEKFRAAAVVALGDEKQPIAEMLAGLSPPSTANRSAYFVWHKKNGVTRLRYQDPRNQLVVEIAVWKDYLVLGIGADELDRVLANSQTDPPAWYTQRRQQLPVKQFCSMSYASRDLMLKIPRDFWRPFGWHALDSFRGMFVVSGLDEKGMLTRASVDLVKSGEGIEDLIQTEPLDEKFFARLPPQPTFGTAVRVSIDDVVQRLSEIGDEIGKDPIAEADKRLREELGVGLKEELLNVLDGFVGVHYTLDGDRPFNQFVMTIGISDEMSFPTIHDTVLASIRKWELPDERSLKMHQHGLHEVYSLPIRGIFFGPRMLAWAQVKEELVLGSDIDSVKLHIDRTADGRTFANTDACRDLKQFGKQNRLGNPIALGTLDLGTVARQLMKFLDQVMTEESELFGGLKYGDLPNVDILTNGIQPNVLGVYRAENGFQLYGRQTLPGSSPITSLVAGGALGAVAELDRFAFDETSHSQNNLKQLALACLNFESATRQLPATGTKAKDGTPLLSWRVHVLPYLAGGAKLYDQFHLDEAWDSPHNKPLIAQMPKVFAHPGLALEAGKTVYLGVAGKNGPFGELNEGKGATRIGRITDGTSNAVLIVECGKSAAEFWTKPADLSTNGQQAVAATKDIPGGVTNVVRCDGSVRRVKQITADVWSRMLNMRDGKRVPIEEYSPKAAGP